MIFSFLNGILYIFFFFRLYESECEYEIRRRILIIYNNPLETLSFYRKITNNFTISQLKRIKFEEQQNDRVFKRTLQILSLLVHDGH